MVAAGEMAGQGLEPVPENLLRNPIEYLRADLFRHHKVSDLLEAMRLNPENPGAADRAKIVLAYLEGDLPLHLEDTGVEMLPRLQDRAGPDCDIVGLERTLRQFRDATIQAGASLAALLKPVATSGILGANGDTPGMIRDFVLAQERLLTWERTVLLPLAQQLLGDGDLVAIGRSMAARRGVPYPD